jgi:hypothetical protein
MTICWADIDRLVGMGALELELHENGMLRRVVFMRGGGGQVVSNTPPAGHEQMVTNDYELTMGSAGITEVVYE